MGANRTLEEKGDERRGTLRPGNPAEKAYKGSELWIINHDLRVEQHVAEHS